MRKVYIVLGVIAVIGLSAGSLRAQNGQVVYEGSSIVAQNGQAGCDSCSGGCSAGCGDCCDACGGCKGCRQIGAYKASFGAFNCSCRGSYKFPVPPQYTYHWPGMYSQQTISEYRSPYRFPPLNLPPDMIPVGAEGPMPQPPLGSQGRMSHGNRSQVRPVAYVGSQSAAQRTTRAVQGR